ncbi:hypothetical protein CPC08DRAFT_788271 [Agrocybe pediades]|nr:hypothetical protein CPC08DRAFT_788271 [Agrocybe pediades]
MIWLAADTRIGTDPESALASAPEAKYSSTNLQLETIFPDMSTAANFPLSIVQQKVLISSNLHSALIYQFLAGVYTGVLPATIYIYRQKENHTLSRDRIVIGCIIALYCITIINLMTAWYSTSVLLCANGATRLEMVIEILVDVLPKWDSILLVITVYISFAFSDGLLVWRCFHACGRSFRKILLPIVLFILEAALLVSSIVYACMLNNKPGFKSLQTVQIFNHLDAAMLIAVAATSLVSTILICLRIWQHTTPRSTSRKRFRTVINALIQSSGIYSATVLLLAILGFLTNGSIPESFTPLVIINYVQGVSGIVAGCTTQGLAPTLMVAQLAWLSYSSCQDDHEVSTAHLPSELITRATQAISANLQDVGTDLEQQQTPPVQVGETEEDEGH